MFIKSSRVDDPAPLAGIWHVEGMGERTMSDVHLIGILAAWVLAGAVYYMGRSFGFDVAGWVRVEAAWMGWSALAATLAAVPLVRFLRARRALHPGDRVIYLAQKFGPHPGPRAEDVYAFPNGEGYSYVVRKPWTVARLVGENAVEVVTRGGKHRVVRADDLRLRRVGRLGAFWFALRTHRPFPRSIPA